MTSRNRNLAIIGLVLALVVASLLLIVPGSPLSKPTVLGLDLRGGVELVYEGRKSTPQAPPINEENINDAIETIRKRTDALGVSEPEIQRAGANQISIGLPDVENADRAIEQVGTTAQLQFYDWEPNVLGPRGPNSPYSGSKALYEAVQAAKDLEPKAEAIDVPLDNPRGLSREEADRQNDTAGEKFYLFDADKKLITGPDASCDELLADFESVEGSPRGASAVPKGSECRTELGALPEGNAERSDDGSVNTSSGPPAQSVVARVPQGIAVVEDEPAPNQPANVQRFWVLEDDAELSGTDIENPEPSLDQSQGQGPAVTMDFSSRGEKAFERVTKRIAVRGFEIIAPPGTPIDQRLQRFAITLDNQIISLATIDFQENPEGIDGRTGAQITGLEAQEAQDLAEQLRIGALPINLKLISQTQVSATLGQQALDQGLIAGAAGLALTVLFLLLFYRVLGAVAAVALVVYAVLLFALVKLIPITLTLPGIAGLILTLGIAADANIVVFERVKEEARAGRSIPAAIAGGYAKALRTIIDANVVTIGVAFILFTLATAGVKGFAFTLGIGTIISLFTAVLATSAILGSMSRTRLIGSRHAIGVAKRKGGWRFDFIGRSKYFFSASGAILVVGALAIAGLGLNFGIDFESGTRIKAPLERTASVDDVRDTLAPLGYSDAKIQKVDEPELGRNVFQIATSTLEPQEVNEVRSALDQDFGAARANFSSNSIGPTFGAQIARTALIAIIASLLLISIYIALRFEAKFAVPVLIAVAHDILITSGVYAIVGREVTTSTVAALLTILGYSLYDTIIVFDRIRENVPRMPRATFSQIVNRSMSEVFTRSLATSVSTLFPVAALMLFGGETLRDFAFALLVGIASGAYSSIFIASPVLTLWKEREPVYVRRRKLVLDDHGGHVPPFASPKIGDEDQPVDAGAPPQGAPRKRRRSAGTGPPRPATAGAPPPAKPEPAEARPGSGKANGGDSPAGDGSRVSSSTGGRSKPKGARSSRGRKKHGRR
ncbi:MAG TPA: protein translocase subunit SecD [Thermoleophilaceae bacterium]|nr:protein translocase subunit SecD [Thermoleophilaceae bacterium]